MGKESRTRHATAKLLGWGKQPILRVEINNEPLSERLGGGLQNRLDWLDSSTALQNTMIKYILIETVPDKTQNPYWYPGVGRQESEFMEITRTSVVTFVSQESLAEYLASQYKNNKRVEIYEVARQLTPVLETKTVVSFK